MGVVWLGECSKVLYVNYSRSVEDNEKELRNGIRTFWQVLFGVINCIASRNGGDENTNWNYIVNIWIAGLPFVVLHMETVMWDPGFLMVYTITEDIKWLVLMEVTICFGSPV